MKKILSLISIVLCCIFTIQIYASHAVNPTYGEKLNVIAIIDKNEIADADVALQKTDINGEVTKFANFLRNEHSSNLKQLNQLAQTMGVKLVDSKLSDNLVKAGQAELDELTAVNGKEFETMYIDDMVNGHRAALNLINTNLLKQVNDPSLKHFIENTRDHVSNHLQKALTLQAMLKKS